MRIVTAFFNPPVYAPECTWSAYDDETYDGEGCAIGTGATREDAITDLLEQMPDTAPVSPPR